MLTTARLHHDIDRGRGGDKVDSIDPAAAPLGTDDEAAGKPPSPAEVKLAYQQEVGRGVSSERERDVDHGVAIWLAAVLTLSCVLITSICFIPP
jgi:hypothetical protein